jgi:hypothetical protein
MAEPLAVWDASAHHAAGGPDDPQWAQICAWALAHGADDDTWRYEIWFLDGPSAAIHRYARNDGGYRYLDYLTGGGARLEPVMIPLGELPPQRLLVNADLAVQRMRRLLRSEPKIMQAAGIGKW